MVRHLVMIEKVELLLQRSILVYLLRFLIGKM